MTPTHRKIYHRFYREVVLPAVTAAALVGLLLKHPVLRSVSWWGCVVFVLYYSAQHTRHDDAEKYGFLSFLLDVLGVVIFFSATRSVGLFEPGPDLSENPTCLFLGIFVAIPLLSVVSRLAAGHPPRIVLSALGGCAAAVGFLASILGWPSTVGSWMMGVLVIGLIVYLACNFIEDGGEPKPNCWGCK